MPLKSLIVMSGAVIASAVAALPVIVPVNLSQGVQINLEGTPEAPSVHKGDRLRVIDQDCLAHTKTSAPCADLYGAIGVVQTLTIERRVGDSTTALIRFPLRRIASR